MKKDLITVFLCITIVCLSGALFKVYKELKDTIEVVYYVNDHLNIAYDNIYYLNKEIDSNYKELEEYKELKNLKKDLARHTN